MLQACDRGKLCNALNTFGGLSIGGITCMPVGSEHRFNDFTQESGDLVALVPAADTARILKTFPRRNVARPARKGQLGR